LTDPSRIAWLTPEELLASDWLSISAIYADEVFCSGFQDQQLIIGRPPKINQTPNHVVRGYDINSGRAHHYSSDNFLTSGKHLLQQRPE